MGRHRPRPQQPQQPAPQHTLKGFELECLNNMFGNGDLTADQAHRIKALQKCYQNLAEIVTGNTVPNGERFRAVQQLRESLFWAGEAVAMESVAGPHAPPQKPWSYHPAR